MKRNAHIRLFVIVTSVWAAFWVAGLPDYYQQYSTAFMVGFEILIFIALVGVAYRLLGRVPRPKRIRVSLWIAFYSTVPLAFYDWLYCGVYLDNGVVFLWRYWYLTAYYVVPWLLFPAVAVYYGCHSQAPTS